MQGLVLPVAETDYAKNIYWVYGLVLNDDIQFDAKEAISRLAKLGIGCRPFFCPMHQQPVLKNLGLIEKFPVAERLYKRGFYLPSGLALNEHKMSRVVDAVYKILT